MVRVFSHTCLQLWRRLRSSDLSTAVFLIGMLLIVATAGISLFELGDGSVFQSWRDSLWWAIVTSTTVGYGDMVPSTVGGRIFAGFVMFAGLAAFATFSASVAAILVERKIREGRGLEEIKSNGHILVLGWNYNGETILNAFTTYAKVLKNRDIVLVNNLTEEEIHDLQYAFKQINPKYVKGDFTSESVLIRAGIKNAEAAVILPDLSSPTRAIADEKTVLATLSVKSIAPNVRVFAHVLEKESMAHLQRANVTDVIVSDEFSGFLTMTHVLFPGIPQVVRNILDPESAQVIKRHPVPGEFKGKTFGELAEHFKKNGNHTVIALIREIESMKIGEILEGDYSFLDEFIDRKFREAGVGEYGRERIQVTVNPEYGHVIDSESFAVTISSATSKPERP